MSNNYNFDFLLKMLNTGSPSGFETGISNIYEDYLSKFCDNVYIDILGNTIGIFNKNANYKIMLTGHCDEIGFQVVYISAEGLIYFRKIGGINKNVILGSNVIIYGKNNSKIEGVIGAKPIHLLKNDEINKIPDISNMWIDIGAKNKKEVEEYVSIGDPITIKPNASYLLNDRITSKGLDDKIGAFVISEVLRNLVKNHKYNHCIYCVGTVQEEIGLRGAKTASFSIEPDISISVDVGFASDTPDINVCEVGDINLGMGPIIYRNADQDKELISKLIKLSKNNIDIQLSADINSVSGTDTASIRVSKSGIRTLSIGIPLRYMHTSVELVDLNDIRKSIDLIIELLKNI